MERKPTKETIKDGKKLKKLRHSLGMTQVQFAEWLDLNSMTPSEYERGNLKVPKMLWLLIGLAKKTGIKVRRRSRYKLA